MVAPPQTGPCTTLNSWEEAQRSVAALTLVPFAQAAMYDVGADGKSVPFTCKTPSTAAIAVLTYPDPRRFSGGPDGFAHLATRSYTYDNALYVLWAVSQGDKDKAAGVLETLIALQRADGGWGFSFDAHKRRFYNAGYVRSGVVAWVVLAIARYTVVFSDRRFENALKSGVSWLNGRYSPKLELIRGGVGRWLDEGRTFEPSYIADWASTEHNVDAYFALRAAHQAGVATADSERLARAISTKLFLKDERRYAQGLQESGRDRVSALDAAGTWTALFELGRGEPQRASWLLQWINARHRTTDDGWAGYKPYAEGPEVWFVEGSLAIALAEFRLGRVSKARALTAEVARLSCVGQRPLLYSTSWAPDFPATPAAAPTLWFGLVAAEVDGGKPAFLWREAL